MMPYYISSGSGRPNPLVLVSALVGNDSMHLNADIPRPMAPLEWGSLDAWMNCALAACFAGAIGWLAVSTLFRLYAGSGKDRGGGYGTAAEKNILLLLVILLPPMLAYASACYLGRVLFFSRYTLYTWPALYTAVGGCVAWLPRRGLRAGAALLLLGLYAYQIPLLMPTTRRADWLGAGEYVRTHATTEDVVIATGEFLPGDIFDANMRWGGKPLGIPVLGAATTQAAVDAALWHLANGNADKPPEAGRAVWLLLQRGGCTVPSPELNRALGDLGLDCTCFPLVAGDTIIVHRISLNGLAAKPPATQDTAIPVAVPEPYSESNVDWASFLDRAFPNPEKAPAQEIRERYGEVLRRAAARMYFDPMDVMVWSLNLLASRQRELALATADVCLEMSPNYSLGLFVRGLALEDLGCRDEARMEIGKAFEGNPFLRRTLSPFTTAYLDGGSGEALRSEVQKLEDMGQMYFTPALWTLYRNRFEPQAKALPVGVYAPRNAHYQAWMTYFGKTSRQIMPLNPRATANLNLVSALMRPPGA
jgi:hypothetical protein